MMYKGAGATRANEGIGSKTLVSGNVTVANVSSSSTNTVQADSGQIYFWSALTLHGTQSQTSEKPRISLRYLIERSKDEGKFLIDKFNDKIEGELSLEITRHDLNESSKPIRYGKVLKS